MQVFKPSWWQLHRWIWWLANVAVDAIWRWVICPVLELIVFLPRQRPGARLRDRVQVSVKRSPMQGCEVESVRVVEVFVRARRDQR